MQMHWAMTQPTRAITPAAIPPASALERAVGTVDMDPAWCSKLECISYIAEQLVIPVVITIVLCNIIIYYVIINVRIRQKWGHFAVMCHSVGSVSVDQDETEMEELAYLYAVESCKPQNCWRVTLQLNGKPVEFCIDTGADMTVIPKELYESLYGATLEPTRRPLTGPNHQTLPVKGKFTASLKYNSKAITEEIYVVRWLRRPLLGIPAIEALDLIQRVSHVQAGTCDFKQLFPKLFQGLG